MTRITSPVGVGCWPRTAKGSELRPSATACSAAASGAPSSIDRRRRTDQPLGDPRQPANRDAEPGRPVGGLVADLIGRLLDQEQVDQRRLARLAGPASSAGRMAGAVGGKEGLCGMLGKALEDR